MKELFSNNYNLTVSNLTAVNLIGDGSNLTNVGGELPYYIWAGLLDISNLTLTPTYADSYFDGDLSVEDSTGSSLGYRILSAGSKFVDPNNKTIIRAPLYLTDDQNLEALSVTAVQPSYISLAIFSNPSASISQSYGEGVTVFPIPIEIRQYK